MGMGIPIGIAIAIGDGRRGCGYSVPGGKNGGFPYTF